MVFFSHLIGYGCQPKQSLPHLNVVVFWNKIKCCISKNDAKTQRRILEVPSRSTLNWFFTVTMVTLTGCVVGGLSRTSFIVFSLLSGKRMMLVSQTLLV